MKANPFYIIWGVVSLLLLGAAGFFLFSSKSAYDATKDTYSENEATIESLQRRSPFPDADGVKAMEELVADYEKAVDDLYQSLATFQRPLRTDLRDDEFPKLVLDKLTAFQAAAKAAGMTIATEEEFYFAMERYRSTLPAPQNVPLLDYQLEAIARLLQVMVDSGVDKLESLSRELLATETAPTDPDPTIGQPVVRYELRVRFESDHEAFQKFINSLANDKEFFYLLRVIRVDNSSPDGPGGGQAGGGGEAGGLKYVDDNGNAPPLELVEQVAQLDLDTDAEIERMAESGFRPVQQDARTVFGDETVRVFAVIDVARFPTPSESGDEDESDE